jgi:quercetin dioxygenase-like cupin family protein
MNPTAHPNLPTHPIVASPRDYARPCAVVGERITVLVTGQDTGSYEIFLQEGAEGSGPPPHHHPWDEAFFVIDGEVSFGIGNEECTALPGTLVVIGLRHEIDVAAVERVVRAAADSRASESAVEGRGGPSPPREG